LAGRTWICRSSFRMTRFWVPRIWRVKI
jgi:hypothetical protein